MAMDRKAAGAFRKECNRRRANNWTVRGYTRRYAIDLGGMQCIYDATECVWLASSAETALEISQWPDVEVGTPGPRIASGYYQGFAALDLPLCAAQELLERTSKQRHPQLHFALTLRANFGPTAYRRWVEYQSKHPVS